MTIIVTKDLVITKRRLNYLNLLRPLPPSFQGSTSGYTSGGTENVIDKFPFASNANATDVGDLIGFTRYTAAGQSSTLSGYVSGGNGPPFPPPFLTNIIEKFPFASDANASDVGDLTQSRSAVTGQTSSTNGYISGGHNTSPPQPLNTIDKFPFASDANAADVGDLTQGRRHPAGQSSTTNGYTTGGVYSSNFDRVNTIDKFPFASNANASDVGDLTQGRYGPTGQSSTTNGYSTGGSPQSLPPSNIIDKFPFASDANATDVGDLTVARWGGAGNQI